jgi:hypothetical protein
MWSDNKEIGGTQIAPQWTSKWKGATKFKIKSHNISSSICFFVFFKC